MNATATVDTAFYAKSGTIVYVKRNEWGQAKDLIDGGICQLTMVKGQHVLEVL